MKKETLEILKRFEKSQEDVLWCGSEEFGWFTFEDFIEAEFISVIVLLILLVVLIILINKK